MSRTTVIVVLVSAAALMCLGAWRVVEAVGRQTAAQAEAAPAVVEVARAERRLLRDTVHLSGTLRPVNEVDVTADVVGRVIAVEAEIGDHVEAGAVLARLDANELGAGLRQARAAVDAARSSKEAAERELVSSERLYEVQGVSEVQLTGIRNRATGAGAQLEQAEASYALAWERYKDATIRSPIGGVVTDRAVGVGQTVSPAAPLFHVQDVSALELEAQLDERVAGKVRAGMPVDVAVRGGETVQGAVRVVSPSLDPRTRKAKAIVSIPEAPFLPYATAEARLVLDEREVVSIPAPAVSHDQGKSFVVVVSGNRAQRLEVVPGISDGEHVEIDALSEGDLVVTAGGATLRDGAAVEPHLSDAPVEGEQP